MIKLKSLLMEYEKGDLIKFKSETTGHHHGQTDIILIATDINDIQVGYIQYSIYNDIPAIQMISVNNKLQRMGIATILMKELQKQYPEIEIQLGNSTDDGTKFINSLPRDYIKNKEYSELLSRLEKLKNIEKKLISYIDNNKGPFPLKNNDKISKISNKINDEMWNIEQQLKNINPGKSLIKI